MDAEKKKKQKILIISLSVVLGLVLIAGSVLAGVFLSPKPITISFIIDEETITLSSKKGTLLTPPDVEDKVLSNGGTKVFDFWIDEQTGEQVDFEAYKVYKNASFLAVFKETIYNITFDFGGDLGVANSLLSQGASLDEVAIPTREGFVFEGWYKNSALTEQIISSLYTVEEETTLYAKWLPLFSVQFFVGNSSISEQKIAEGRVARDPSINQTPLKPADENYDYIFDKWVLEGEPLFTGKISNYAITKNTTFTASFLSFSKTVAVSFISNIEGASNIPESFTKKRGEALGLSVEQNPPSLYGYFLKEWQAKSESINIMTYMIPTNDYTLNSLTITIVFAKETYSLQVYNENGVPTTIYAEFGSTWEEPEIETPSGYEFDGSWFYCVEEQEHEFDFKTTAKEENHELKVYPKFTAIVYSISWNLNDDDENITNPNTNTTYKITDASYSLKNPKREGFNFDGWFTDESLEGDRFFTITKDETYGNLEFFAKWSIKSITVAFFIETSGYSSQKTCFYNESITPLDVSEIIPVGYNFNGWFEKEEGEFLETSFDFGTLLKENLSLFAKLERKTYTLTFNDNYAPVQEVASSKLYEDLWDTPEENPSRDHYDFTGWYKVAAFNEQDNNTQFNFGIEIATENLTIYAGWRAKTYAMSFYLDLDKNDLYTTTLKYYNHTWEKATPNPSKNHYIFKGWFKDTSFNQPVEWDSLRATGNIDVYAKWEIKQYKLTLHATPGVFDNQQTTKEIYANFNSPWIAPTPPPTRAEYTFGGWYYESTGFTNEFNWENLAAPETQTILYAKWIGPTLYKLNTYSSLEAFENSPPLAPFKTYNYPFGDDRIKYIDRPEKEHYTFNGWYQLIDEEPVLFTSQTMPNRALNLFAAWAPKQYTIVFNVDGGSPVQSVQKTYEKTWDFGEEENWNGPISEKTHFDLAGWFEKRDEEFLEDPFNFSSTVDGDLTLYAKWVKTTYRLTLNNMFDNPPYAYLEAEYLSSWNTPSDPEQDGYTFSGWKTTPGGTTNFNFNSTAESNVTIYARWDPIVYYITWVLQDSAEYKASNPNQRNTYQIDSPTFQVLNASRTGHIFKGWYNNENYEGNAITEISIGSYGHLSLYAKWEIITYNLSLYLYNGLTQSASLLDTLTADYGSYWNEPEDPTMTENDEHFSFKGWLEKEHGSLNLNEPLTTFNFSNTKAFTHKEIYAYFKPNSYTLTFDSQGGGVIAPITKTFNSKWWSYIPTPTNEDWISLVGWQIKDSENFFNTDGTAVATESLELVAVWQYTITLYFYGNGGYFDDISPATQNLTHYYTYAYPIEFNQYSTDITKLGYDFLGWYELDGNEDFLEDEFSFEGENDKFYYHIYAKWQIINYSITYELPVNDQSLDLSSYDLPANYTIESSTLHLNSSKFLRVFRDDVGKFYDLCFYSDIAREEENKVASIIKGSYGNRILYLDWVLHSFSISYVFNLPVYENAKNITNPNEIGSVTNESASFLLGDLEGASYYTFEGWFYANSQISTIEPGVLANDLSLVAHWAPIEYTIEYNIPEEYNILGMTMNNPNPSAYTIESEFYLVNAFIDVDGAKWQSLRWFTDEDLTNEITEIEAGSYENLSLWAEWVKKFITVYFETELSGDFEENTVSFYSTFDYDEEVLEPYNNPIQRYYTFLGWYEFDEFGVYKDEPFEFGEIAPDNDFTLHAKWEKIEYEVFFYSNGANEGDLDSIMVVWGELVSFPNVTKTGFTFAGWFLDEDFLSEIWNIEEDTMPTENISFYAKWTAV